MCENLCILWTIMQISRIIYLFQWLIIFVENLIGLSIPMNIKIYIYIYKLIFLIMKIFVYNDFSDDSKIENLYTNFRILIKNLNCVIFIYLSIWNRLITSFNENKHCEQIQINTKKNSQYWNFLSKNNIKSTTHENITTTHHITPTT